MWTFLKIFLDICTFKAGPSRVPYSVVLMLMLAILNTAITLAIVSRSVEWNISVAVVTTSVFTLMGALYIFLAILGFRDRFVQVFTAILGVDILFTSVINLTVGVSGQPTVLTLILYIWSLAVYVNIFREGLQASVLQALFAAMVIEMFNLAAVSVVLQTMLPSP